MSFTSLGSVAQFPELAAIYESIVEHRDTVQLDGHPMVTKKYKGGTLYAVRHKEILYIEQNQNTQSDYAERARAGAKIVWVIRPRDNNYLGYIENGEVFMKPRTMKA